MKIDTRECPPEAEKRLLTGTSDIMEIFNAHSEYTMPLRVSVLAGVLAVVTIQMTDGQMAEVMHHFMEAVQRNREGIKPVLNELIDNRADAFMAQLKAAQRK